MSLRGREMAAFPINPQPGAQLGTVPGGGGGSTSMQLNPLGQNPMMTAAATSPVAATLPGGGTIPTVPGSPVTTSTGGYNPSAGLTNINAPTHGAGSKTLAGDLQAIYGQGTGTAIGNVLSNLGTTTSIAAEQMIQPTMQAAQQGYGDIEAAMGARGVSADSSTAGLAAGDYWGKVSQGISQEMGQIGLTEEQQLLQSLTGAGQTHGGDVSGWQTFGNVMQGLGQAGLGLGEAYLTGGMAGTGSITGGLSKMFGGGKGPGSGGAGVGGFIEGQTVYS